MVLLAFVELIGDYSADIALFSHLGLQEASINATLHNIMYVNNNFLFTYLFSISR